MTDDQLNNAIIKQNLSESYRRLIKRMTFVQDSNTSISGGINEFVAVLHEALRNDFISEKVKNEIIITIMEELKRRHEAAEKEFAEL